MIRFVKRAFCLLRRTLVIALLSEAVALVGLAESVSIGVPDFPKDLEYLDSRHPLALIARSAVLAPMIEVSPAGTTSLRLRLAAQMVTSADHRTLSLLVQREAHFQNGRSVSAEDIAYALGRCREKGRLPGVVEISVRTPPSTARASLLTPVQSWVDLRGMADAAQVKTLLAALAQCPIFEKKSAQLFGVDFGHGTNLVGSGPFRLREYRSGREVVLSRVSSGVLDREGAAQITLRAFSDARQGVTALRVGTLDALFTKDPLAVEKSRGDATLVVRECGEYQMIIRRGFTLTCADPLDLSDLRYVF